MSVTYIVSIYTSDIKKAGTESNVFISIYGKKIDTGKSSGSTFVIRLKI